MSFTKFTLCCAVLVVTFNSGCFEERGPNVSKDSENSTAPSPEKKPSGPVAVGDTVPDLKIAKLLQSDGKETLSLGELQGSTVVLEFWATWCPPCVASIPHLNELVDEFADDENVVFISVTDEPEATVNSFLQKHTMHSQIGLDEGQDLHTAFGINSIPKAFLINSEGQVKHILHPMELDAKLITNVQKGQ